MRRKLTKLNAALCLILSQGSAHAGTGDLFSVTATGTPATISVTVCLNAIAKLSCQNYTVSATNLSIKTTALNHNYPNAGIMINTPGYTASGCTPLSNGMCSFSANNTSTTTVTLQSTTQTPVLTAAGQDTTGVGTPLLVASTDSAATWKVINLNALLISFSYLNATSCTGSGGTAICTAVGHLNTGNHTLLEVSTNGTTSWSPISSGIPSTGIFYSTSCTGTGSSAICAAAGEDTSNAGMVGVSVNGGVNWSTPTLTGIGTQGNLKSVSCTGSGSSAICVAAGEDIVDSAPKFSGAVVVSTDGGVNWAEKTVAGIPARSHLLGASCTGSGSSAVCAAAGEDRGGSAGLIVASNNGGVTWTTQSIAGNVTPSRFYGISCTGSGSSAICVAAGEDNINFPNGSAAVAVSADGGTSWAMKSITNNPQRGHFNAASCTGSGASAICVAAGQSNSTTDPLLAVSSDGGSTWAIQTINGLTSNGLFSAVNCNGVGSSAVCTVAGHDNITNAPLLAVSTNGGVTWSVVNNSAYSFPSAGAFYGVGGSGFASLLSHKKVGVKKHSHKSPAQG